MNGSTTRSRKKSKDTLKQIKSNPKSVGHRENNIRGKFIAVQSYLNRQEKAQINNITSHLKELEKGTTKKT